MTKLHWIEAPWKGRIAVAARPRGGKWLREDIEGWSREGVKVVLSLLTWDEVQYLELAREPEEAEKLGIEFTSFPIPDRTVPASFADLAALLERLDSELSSGKNLAIHCRQGIGRSGLVAASLLIRKGITPTAAADTVRAARGLQIPETKELRQWLDHCASLLAGKK